MLSVNVEGAINNAAAAVDPLRETEGAIVNVASVAAEIGSVDVTYAASKAGILGVTRSLARELGDDDVTVNAVCPGATRGPRIEDVIENQAEQRGISYEAAKRKVFTDDTALDRLTEPEDVAETVAYLASERARNVTAQDINVDAGTVWY